MTRKQILGIFLLANFLVWALLIVLLGPVRADPVIPDEATKKAALMLAYELNGNSMVRMGSIDLSGPLPKADRAPLPEPKKKQNGK